MTNQQRSSIITYVALIIILAILSAVNIYMPQGSFATVLSEQQLPQSTGVIMLVVVGTMIIVYGGLGILGLWLAQRMNFPGL